MEHKCSVNLKEFPQLQLTVKCPYNVEQCATINFCNTGGGTSDTKAFTHIEEAMSQVIKEVQVSGIPVDSKTQALLNKTWMKVMWMTQDCHQGPLHLDLGQVGRTSGQLQWKTVRF
ncbi:hypothetical protein Pcinc_002401 [Petrolisthes cinctipes]|uniref:Uncharacterized protein n=1 Tax=Petrolisthes cinctipes TaxID=88211 RepID=A0AAE1GI86_PETCI|nr:hypothetical protein Pcinc_002401 [Petrolisthes cinctipes]